MIDTQRLIEQARGLNVDVTGDQAQKLGDYCTAVLEMNRHLNLTAITDPRDVEVKHVLDCITLCALPELRGRVADVGTGAGFPGVVIKIAKPDLDVTVIDATRKKLGFIETACRRLGIEVTAVHGRAEELARGQHREQFDTVCARAVAPLGSLVEYCLPLVKVGGHFIAMKGPEAASEISDSLYAIETLGGQKPQLVKATLPGDIERTLITIKKISQTPSHYPRNGKNITKSPIKKR